MMELDFESEINKLHILMFAHGIRQRDYMPTKQFNSKQLEELRIEGKIRVCV